MRDVYSVHVFHLDATDAFDELINRIVCFMSTSGAPVRSQCGRSLTDFLCTGSLCGLYSQEVSEGDVPH